MRFRQSPNENAAVWFIVIGSILFLICLSWWISGNRSYRKGWDDAMETVVPDTVWRTDTITYEKPVEVEKWKDRIVYVPVTDTIHKHDTTYIALQFERKVYQDSTYRSVVSGFQPSLDWIEVYQKTTTITQYVEKPTHYKWTLSAFAEAGATLYRFDVRAGLEYERQIAGPLRGAISAGYEYSNIGRGVFVEGGVKLQILKK